MHASLVGLVVVLHHAFDVEQFMPQPAAVMFLSPVVWSLKGPWKRVSHDLWTHVIHCGYNTFTFTLKLSLSVQKLISNNQKGYSLEHKSMILTSNTKDLDLQLTLFRSFSWLYSSATD